MKPLQRRRNSFPIDKQAREQQAALFVSQAALSPGEKGILEQHDKSPN